MRGNETVRIDTVVIGGGQAGLSVGYHLRRREVPFVILDASARIGDVWRGRWESLRLFTPARFDGLDGLSFPAPANSFPTKDAMADYLEAYARRFDLPVKSGARVTRVSRAGEQFLVADSTGQHYEADNVVVAMANYQRPRVPPFAAELDSSIRQLHSLDYRTPDQLQSGDVLLVGAGNSGAEIGVEVARSHRTCLAGRDVGEVPFEIGGRVGRLGLTWLVLRVLFHRVMTVATPIGRRVRPKVLHGSGPLIRTKARQLAAAGVARVPRVAGVRDGLPLLEDGRTLAVTNVIWCTGFEPGFSWLDLPVFDDDGQPRHERGVVAEEPGLFFVGLHFLYSFSSTMIHGVSRDAARVATAIAARQHAFGTAASGIIAAPSVELPRGSR